MHFTAFVIFPIKDFFIALLFSYMYYRQGKKHQSELNGNDDLFVHIKNDPLFDRDISNEM